MNDADKIQSIPNLIIENAASAFSRLRNFLSKNQSEENDGRGVIENKNAFIELKSILKKNGQTKSVEQQNQRRSVKDGAEQLINFKDCNTKRREKKAGAPRSGPRPIEELPVSERSPSPLTHATLNPNFHKSRTGEMCDGDLPSNKGLLTYFARIGSSGSSEEEVDLKFVLSLLSAGADINIGDKYGQRILHAVSRDWHIDIAKFVISLGGDINATDDFGRTPLHVAAAVNYPEMIKFLVGNGANLHSRTEGELQTPIHYAAKFNAVDSVECLIKLGAKVSDRDYKERTPLFLAAENGRRDVVEFLLRIEAPAAVYDNVGTCAVALMVEKMPDLTMKALDQFLIEDKPTRTNYFHLCSLEYDTRCKIGRTPAKSVLETIVLEDNSELAQHAVITKLIEVKWKMIAKWQAMFDIAINFIHACLFTALTVTINFDGSSPLYADLKKDAWKITIEIIFILITIYFVFKQFKTGNRAKQKHTRWQEWRIVHMAKDFAHCHPQWPEEKRYIKDEIARIRETKVSKHSGWVYYEWVTVLGIVCIMIIQPIYAVKPSKQSGAAAKFLYLIELFLIWIKLLKPMKSVPAMSSLIVILSDIVKGSIQFLYIFMEFYIPLAIAFHIMFGGDQNNTIMRNAGNSDSIAYYESFQTMLFSVLWVTLGGSLGTDPLMSIDKVMAEIMVSILFAALKLVAMNLFISLISYLFGRAYNKARATALLQSANYILTAERNLDAKKAKKFRKRMRIHCNPMATYETGMLRKGEENEIGINLKSLSTNIRKLMAAISEESGETEKVDEYEMHKIRIILHNVEETEILQEEAEKEFDEKWGKIMKNQTEINNMLKCPEVKEFILKSSQGHFAGKRRQRSDSLSSK